MSLVVSFPKEVPADTRRLAEPKLDPDSICRLLGEMAHEIIDEDELAEMYPQRGRGAINPVVLCIVTILQYCEDLPDRAAAKMAVMRLDWMFAARQPPDWQGFDFSSLCNFRKRLRKHGKDRVIFDRVVNFLRERGYLKAGRQRLDSTHMLGDVERKSRLETVWDSLRSALLAVMAADAQWASQRLPASFVAEHSQERSDYRLNKAQIRQAMISAGQDGFWLLSQLAGTPLAGLEEVALLARVLEEQFARSDADDDVDADGDAEAGITPKANVDASGDVIATPHDPDARFSRKRGTEWLGHKTQVTETVDGDFRIISDIDIHSAIESDGQALAAIFERLKERGLLPETLFVDQGYCHGETLKDSEQKGVDLRGPVGDDTRKPPGFRLQDFDIDLDKQRAICPAGRFSVSFNPSKQDDVGWHVRFGPQCNACLFRSLCTTAKRGRSLEVSPYHEYLAKRRLEQARPEFQEEMKQRILIESTIGELTRKHGLRRSRYRGQEKARLQAAFTAAAVNLKRLARHLAEAPRFLRCRTWRRTAFEAFFQLSPVARPCLIRPRLVYPPRSPRINGGKDSPSLAQVRSAIQIASPFVLALHPVDTGRGRPSAGESFCLSGCRAATRVCFIRPRLVYPPRSPRVNGGKDSPSLAQVRSAIQIASPFVLALHPLTQGGLDHRLANPFA